MIPFYIPGRMVLGVPQGGPDSLKWTAAVYNERLRKIISEYVPFKHGTNALTIPIWANSVQKGDGLSVVLHNDEGTGSVSFGANVMP